MSQELYSQNEYIPESRGSDNLLLFEYVLLEEKLRPGSQVLRRCRMEAVPEFMRFNIVEPYSCL